MTAANLSPDLDAIQARADAATEGPWEVYWYGGVQSKTDSKYICQAYGIEGEANPDADFIAHARTDVPALLALVRDQAAQIERVEALGKEFFDISNAPDFGPIESLAAYRDASRAIRAALTATEGAA